MLSHGHMVPLIDIWAHHALLAGSLDWFSMFRHALHYPSRGFDSSSLITRLDFEINWCLQKRIYKSEIPNRMKHENTRNVIKKRCPPRLCKGSVWPWWRLAPRIPQPLPWEKSKLCSCTGHAQGEVMLFRVEPGSTLQGADTHSQCSCQLTASSSQALQDTTTGYGRILWNFEFRFMPLALSTTAISWNQVCLFILYFLSCGPTHISTSWAKRPPTRAWRTSSNHWHFESGSCLEELSSPNQRWIHLNPNDPSQQTVNRWHWNPWMPLPAAPKHLPRNQTDMKHLGIAGEIWCLITRLTSGNRTCRKANDTHVWGTK